MDLVMTAELNQSTVAFMLALAGDAASSTTRTRDHFLSMWEQATLSFGSSQSFRGVLAGVRDSKNVSAFIKEAFRRKGIEVIVKSVNAGTLDLCFDDSPRSPSSAFIEGVR